MNVTSFIGPARCLVLAAVVEIAAMSSAGALSISFDKSQMSAVAGSSVDFSGTIQNDTFYVLATSTDLFLNFSSYDPTVLSPNDLLPLSSALLLPGSTSAALALIGVDVAPGTAPGLYELQVSMQDVFGGEDTDSTGVYTLFISVVPEPASYLLMLAGLAAATGARRLRGSWRSSSLAEVESPEIQP